MSFSFFFHMFLHIMVPLSVAWLVYEDKFRKAFLIMIAGLAIDIDHLFVTPVLDPERCSVGFHLFHSYWFSALYLLLAIIPKTRLIGLGLVIHIVLDALECFRQFYLEELLQTIFTN